MKWVPVSVQETRRKYCRVAAELPVWKLAVTTRARAEEPPTGSAI